MGDSSDNIPPAWLKCGYKTALKCFNDTIYFEQCLINKPENRYHLNRLLVDFDYIPCDIINEFLISANIC